MGIKENLEKIRKEIPASVTLCAVSKTMPVEDILEAYHAGQRIFGENKAQELISKQPQLPSDIEWHFIGHLQTNKVKYLVPFVSLIHSVDSLKLLKEIDKQSAKLERVCDVLLQFHIASEETKFGLDLQEAYEILQSEEFHSMKNIRITGVMGMASFTSNLATVRKEFAQLHDIFHQLKNEFFKSDDEFRTISMGMSGDYEIAIQEGSTLVRVGTAIFGERHYA